MSTSSIIPPIKQLYGLLSTQDKWKWGGIFGFAICNSMFELITATIIVVFAQVLNQPSIGQAYMIKLGFAQDISPTGSIIFISSLCGSIYLIKNIISAIEVFFQNYSIQKMSYHLKRRLLHKFADLDYNFYLTRNTSYGFTVVSSEVDMAYSVGMTSLSTIVSESTVFLFLTLMVIYLNPSLAIFIFAIGITMSTILIKYIFPLFYEWGKKMQESSFAAHQHLLQFFHGFKEVILWNKRDTFIEAFQTCYYRSSRIKALQTATNALPRMVLEVLFVGLFVATILYLCLQKETPQQIIGILGGYLYVGFRLMPGLNRIINQLNLFKASTPSITRVYEETTTNGIISTFKNSPDLKFEKDITFKNVCFRYLSTESNVLNTINLKIKKGEVFGIVGETGSGKSTIIDLIVGLLKPSQGSILVDGKYPVDSYQWHAMLGYVPQTTYLIDDTIEANIAFGEEMGAIDHQRLNKSIEEAQLSAFIDQLPEGAKTIVGERGIRLSGGERQRISIARALYRQPTVLIFDEATSSLDNKTEALLMDTIHSVSQNRTVIMVAHRLSTLKDCGKIIAMEKGQVSEILKYQELQDKRVKKHG